MGTFLLSEWTRFAHLSGVDEILLPGEIEWRTRSIRKQSGIPLPEVT